MKNGDFADYSRVSIKPRPNYDRGFVYVYSSLAKDTGDIDALREIASDPQAFIHKQSWASVELADEKEIKALRRLLEMLQIKIAEVIEATNQLKESPDYELYTLSLRDPSILDTVSKSQQQQIEAECSKLSEEAKEWKKQIEELTGEAAMGRA